MSAAAYEYDAYRFAKDRPLVRLSRHAANATSRVAEYHLDWGWTEPVRIALGDEVFVTVTPFTAEDTAYHAKLPGQFKWGLVGWGRCSAHLRRWGATLPLDLMDLRVVAALREAEEMEALAWVVLADGDSPS